MIPAACAKAHISGRAAHFLKVSWTLPIQSWWFNWVCSKEIKAYKLWAHPNMYGYVSIHQLLCLSFSFFVICICIHMVFQIRSMDQFELRNLISIPSMPKHERSLSCLAWCWTRAVGSIRSTAVYHTKHGLPGNFTLYHQRHVKILYLRDVGWRF